MTLQNQNIAHEVQQRVRLAIKKLFALKTCRKKMSRGGAPVAVYPDAPVHRPPDPSMPEFSAGANPCLHHLGRHLVMPAVLEPCSLRPAKAQPGSEVFVLRGRAQLLPWLVPGLHVCQRWTIAPARQRPMTLTVTIALYAGGLTTCNAAAAGTHIRRRCASVYDVF